MDRARTSALLAELSVRVGTGTLLWRGPDLSGSDVDLVALPGAEAALAAMLRDAGLEAGPGDPSHVVWRPRDGADVAIDVLPWTAWPAYYPSLRRVVSRARPAPATPPVAAPEDRLLMLGAEAVAGRPLAKIASRAESLLNDAGVRDRLDAVAAAEGLETFACLVAAPERLRERGRHGRLPYPSAVRAAVRSAPARAALRSRVAARRRRLVGDRPARRGRAAAGWGVTLRRIAHHPRSAGHDRPLLVAVSGMDGSGKSTVTEALRAGLAERGAPAITTWGRFAGDTEVLDRVALVGKRLLRRPETTADPVAAGAPAEEEEDGPVLPSRRGPVGWIWVLFLAALSARRLRQAGRHRRGGISVVADRWLADSVVDMELRYGRHRVAELVMSVAAPRPDLGLILLVDHATAFRRNSEDQARWVLAAMEAGYAQAVGRFGLVPLDARRSAAEVVRDARALLDTLPLRAFEGRQRATPPDGTER